MFAFGIALAFVVLFNATTINILERTRETASLRSLGFHRFQIGVMITIENLITWAAGMLVGLPVGRCLATLFMVLWRTETFHPRLYIYPSTYLLTIFGILITVLVSQLPGIRYVSRLNLASATKEISG
ncbi:MAG: FtsX-like permease family protein, partial [Armatimonadota bacterium]